MKKTMKKTIFLLLSSFLPFVLILFFADPNQGMFAKNFGSLASTIISGAIGFYILEKYSNKNAIGASIGWMVILAAGLWIASSFH